MWILTSKLNKTNKQNKFKTKMWINERKNVWMSETENRMIPSGVEVTTPHTPKIWVFEVTTATSCAFGFSLDIGNWNFHTSFTKNICQNTITHNHKNIDFFLIEKRYLLIVFDVWNSFEFPQIKIDFWSGRRKLLDDYPHVTITINISLKRTQIWNWNK